MRLIIKKTYISLFFALALLPLLEPALSFAQQFAIVDALPDWLHRNTAIFLSGLVTITLPWIAITLATALALLFALGTSARLYSVVVVVALQLMVYGFTGGLTFSWHHWAASLPGILGAFALVPITLLLSLKRF
ncbi:hypothetical protein [Kistimonas asteriae]|uniref:hypothetical protein n=1 Tax=Kistimonas asteriae TaxID=517724 RepID=UPI001BAE484A|nr:hypothetical protein [Kistimonas asteriae]